MAPAVAGPGQAQGPTLYQQWAVAYLASGTNPAPIPSGPQLVHAPPRTLPKQPSYRVFSAGNFKPPTPMGAPPSPATFSPVPPQLQQQYQPPYQQPLAPPPTLTGQRPAYSLPQGGAGSSDYPHAAVAPATNGGVHLLPVKPRRVEPPPLPPQLRQGQQPMAPQPQQLNDSEHGYQFAGYSTHPQSINSDEFMRRQHQQAMLAATQHQPLAERYGAPPVYAVPVPITSEATHSIAGYGSAQDEFAFASLTPQQRVAAMLEADANAGIGGSAGYGGLGYLGRPQAEHHVRFAHSAPQEGHPVGGTAGDAAAERRRQQALRL